MISTVFTKSHFGWLSKPIQLLSSIRSRAAKLAWMHNSRKQPTLTLLLLQDETEGAGINSCAIFFVNKQSSVVFLMTITPTLHGFRALKFFLGDLLRN